MTGDEMRAAITAALAEVPELDAEFVADRILPTVRGIADQRAAQALRAAADDRTTVSKLTPVESLTCFVVKLEDLFHRAAALGPTS